MTQAATHIRRAIVALLVVLVSVLVGGRSAGADELAPILVRYTLSPAGHDAISVTTDAGLTAARRVLQGAVLAAGVDDRTNAAVVITDRNNGPVLQATVDDRLATREGDHLRLAIAPSAMGDIADQLDRDVVLEVCLPKHVARDLTNLIIVRETTVLNCFNGAEAAVFTLVPGASRPANVEVVLRPSLAAATGVWLTLWVAAGLCTLAFWGLARLLRRWLVLTRPGAARRVGGGVGVLVAAIGVFVSWALGGFGGPAFNVAYLRTEGTGSLVAVGLATAAPGAIAGIVFFKTLVPRFVRVPIQPSWPTPPVPPPYGLPTYGAPAAAPDFPSWWEPVAPAPLATPPIPLPPAAPTWVVPPPPPVSEAVPPETNGRLALVLGLFGGAVPVVGGAAAVLVGRAARERAPRRARAATALGWVQLGAWPALALLCLV